MRDGFSSYVILSIVGAIISVGSGVGIAYMQQQNSMKVTDGILVEQTPVPDLSPAPLTEEEIQVETETESSTSPGGVFERARDTQRRSDLISIITAVYQYAEENDGSLPGDDNFPNEETCIGTSEDCFNLANAGIEPLVPTYIDVMPVDPLNGTDENTQYTIYINQQGRIVANAKSEVTESGVQIIR